MLIYAVSLQYAKVLKRITKIDPNRIFIGLTSTPTRMKK